jgi:hypothetical protein
LESNLHKMPELNYPFLHGGPKRLSLSWKKNYKDILIILDENIIGDFQDKASFPKPFLFVSPDGNEIRIELKQNWELFLNNKPLPYSPNDPIHRVRTAYLILYGYGILHLFSGSIIYGLARIESIKLLSNLSILSGLIFLILGILLQRGNKYGLLVGLIIIFLHFAFVILPWEKPDIIIGGKGLVVAVLDAVLIFLLIRAYPHLKNYTSWKSINSK